MNYNILSILFVFSFIYGEDIKINNNFYNNTANIKNINADLINFNGIIVINNGVAIGNNENSPTILIPNLPIIINPIYYLGLDTVNNNVYTIPFTSNPSLSKQKYTDTDLITTTVVTENITSLNQQDMVINGDTITIGNLKNNLIINSSLILNSANPIIIDTLIPLINVNDIYFYQTVNTPIMTTNNINPNHLIENIISKPQTPLDVILHGNSNLTSSGRIQISADIFNFNQNSTIILNSPSIQITIKTPIPLDQYFFLILNNNILKRSNRYPTILTNYITNEISANLNTNNLIITPDNNTITMINNFSQNIETVTFTNPMITQINFNQQSRIQNAFSSQSITLTLNNPTDSINTINNISNNNCQITFNNFNEFKINNISWNNEDIVYWQFLNLPSIQGSGYSYKLVFNGNNLNILSLQSIIHNDITKLKYKQILYDFFEEINNQIKIMEKIETDTLLLEKKNQVNTLINEIHELLKKLHNKLHNTNSEKKIKLRNTLKKILEILS